MRIDRFGLVATLLAVGCTPAPDALEEPGGLVVDGYLVDGDPYAGWEPQGSPVEERTRVTHDAAELAERVTYLDELVPLRPIDGSDAQRDAPALTLVAEIAPPLAPVHHPDDYALGEDGLLHHEGEHEDTLHALQANSVVVAGDTVVATWHLRGELLAGVVEVIDISDPMHPVLVSSAGYDHMDFSTLSYVPDDASGRSGTVYAAAGTCDPNYHPYTAMIERFRVEDQRIDPTPAYRFGLPGVASTGISVNGDTLFAGTGDDGGWVSLDHQQDVRLAFGAVHDVRGVDANEDLVAVVKGSATYGEGEDSALILLDADTLEQTGRVAFEGLEIPWAKAAVQLVGERAWVAAGEGGMHVYGTSSLELLTDVWLPEDSGYDPEEVVTNDVTIDEDLVLMANGALGVWVGRLAADDAANDAPFDISLLGAFESRGSLNDVALAGDTLVLASGAVGLQLLHVQRD